MNSALLETICCKTPVTERLIDYVAAKSSAVIQTPGTSSPKYSHHPHHQQQLVTPPTSPPPFDTLPYHHSQHNHHATDAPRSFQPARPVEVVRDVPSLRFKAWRSHLPSLSVFVAHVVDQSRARTPTLLVTLVYLDRLQRRLPVTAKGMDCTSHRVFLAALILAAKYTNDSSPKNKHWSRYSSIFSLPEVNLMEKQLLLLLDFELNVTEKDLFVQIGPLYDNEDLRYASTASLSSPTAAAGSTLRSKFSFISSMLPEIPNRPKHARGERKQHDFTRKETTERQRGHRVIDATASGNMNAVKMTTSTLPHAELHPFMPTTTTMTAPPALPARPSRYSIRRALSTITGDVSKKTTPSRQHRPLPPPPAPLPPPPPPSHSDHDSQPSRLQLQRQQQQLQQQRHRQQLILRHHQLLDHDAASSSSNGSTSANCLTCSTATYALATFPAASIRNSSTSTAPTVPTISTASPAAVASHCGSYVAAPVGEDATFPLLKAQATR